MSGARCRSSSAARTPSSRKRRRQADVDDRDVGPLELHGVDERVAVLHRRDHVEAVVPEQPREPVAQEREVFGDYDPHGSSARTVVGPRLRARDVQRPVERLSALPETGEAAARRIRSAVAVVDHLGYEDAVRRAGSGCRREPRVRA